LQCFHWESLFKPITEQPKWVFYSLRKDGMFYDKKMLWFYKCEPMIIKYDICLWFAFNAFNNVKELIWWWLWVLRCVWKYVHWIVFYVLYEKLRMHVMMERFYKSMRWYELHKCESLYTEHKWCGSTNMYEIMNAEHKTLVERHLGRASVRPVRI
jgi:hypothetical protein